MIRDDARNAQNGSKHGVHPCATELTAGRPGTQLDAFVLALRLAGGCMKGLGRARMRAEDGMQSIIILSTTCEHWSESCGHCECTVRAVGSVHDMLSAG